MINMPICGNKFIYAKKLQTSLPYFGVKLSCVCLMFAYRKIAYSYPKVTHSDPTHLPLPQTSPSVPHLAIS